MAFYAHPYVLQCVELACKREAAAVHGKLKKGLLSLAVISAIAPLFGFFGTVLGIQNSFMSFGSSRSTILAAMTERLSEAMLPTLLALLVALPAFYFYKYLSSEVEALNLEMEWASSDVINRLLVYVRELKITDRLAWAALTARPEQIELDLFRFEDRTGVSDAPRFNIGRIYRNGFLELIWPRLDCKRDAELVLHSGMWVSFAYGFLGWFTCVNQHRPSAGLLVFAFFAVAGLGVRRGSVEAILGLFAFLAWACIACLVPFEWTLPAVCLAGAPLLLVGSFRAARFLATDHAQGRSERFPVALLSTLYKILLMVLGFSASTAVLFGTALALYSMGGDHAMEPTLYSSDWIISVNAPLIAPKAIRRRKIVMARGLGIKRVAGLPGDRIQVESGKLIRNGVPIAEPYCRKSYRKTLGGDFPLPSESFAESSPLGREHPSAYGDTLDRGKPYIVPDGSFFLLNDDRNDLDDSRILGPVWDSYIAGRPLVAYSPEKGPFPRTFR